MTGGQEKPVQARITMGKFANVDMRVAEVVAAPLAEGTARPCRVIELYLGHLGTLTSVGQYALVAEEELVGRNVVACVNLAPREMGPYTSEALVLGTPHPESPADQSQAIPLYASALSSPGDQIY